MKKIFISQRMHNRPLDDIMDERERAAAAVKELFPNDEISIIDQVHQEGISEDAGRLVKLGRSIQLLDQADFVYFCRDWEFANGCHVEKKVCDLYRIPYIFEKDL